MEKLINVVIRIPESEYKKVKSRIVWVCEYGEYIAQGNAIPEVSQKTKDHIMYLAGDYKCWDNHLSREESLELCHLLEAIENKAGDTDGNS